MDRKAELERKKAKLAAIREEKERRRREKEAKDMEDATNKISSAHDKDARRYWMQIIHPIYFQFKISFTPQRLGWNAFVFGRCTGVGSVVFLVLGKFDYIGYVSECNARR